MRQVYVFYLRKYIGLNCEPGWIGRSARAIFQGTAQPIRNPTSQQVISCAEHFHYIHRMNHVNTNHRIKP